MSPRMRFVFTLSILLNIVFVGVGVGLLFRFCQDVPIPGEVSPEARHFIAKTFQEGRDQIKPLIDEVKKEREKVEDILTAETFDSKAYATAVDKMLNSREKITRKRAEIMGKALVDLPAADRKAFANRVLDGLEGNRPRKGGYHHQMLKDEKDAPPPPPGTPENAPKS